MNTHAHTLLHVSNKKTQKFKIKIKDSDLGDLEERMSCYIPFEFHFYFQIFLYSKIKTNKHENYFRYNVSLLVGFDKITETHFQNQNLLFKIRKQTQRQSDRRELCLATDGKHWVHHQPKPLAI